MNLDDSWNVSFIRHHFMDLDVDQILKLLWVEALTEDRIIWKADNRCFFSLLGVAIN